MTAEIKRLSSTVINSDRSPQADTIAVLKDALTRAETGEFQAVAVVWVDRDGEGCYEIARPLHVGFPDLIAHTARLSRALLEMWGAN